MRILFDSNTGKIYNVVLDIRWNSAFPYKYESGKYWVLRMNGELNIHIGLDLFEIDELNPSNNLLCADLISKTRKFDIDQEQKYFMYDNAGTWELHEKDGWEQDIGGAEE